MEIGWQRFGSPTLDGILYTNEGDVGGLTHVADLTAYLRAKLQGQGVNAHTMSLKLHGTTLGDGAELAPLLPTLRTGNLRWTLRVSDIPHDTSSQGTTPHVYIKTHTGKVFSLDIPLEASVEEVKIMIAAQEGIPPEQQRLIFAAHQLEDDQSLAHYNITHDCTLILVLRLRGGNAASTFVDVENDNAMRTVAFASSAPRWRVIVQGLNLHGLCLNHACDACEQEVIAPIGLKPFNIVTQQVFCPMCKCAIEARTCGFYNCEWRFEGVKANTGVHVASDWKTLPSHDAYNLFDDDESNMALWRSLVLVVQSSSLGNDCVLCKGGGLREATPCGHMHRRCADVWVASSDMRRSVGITCPDCHAAYA